LLNVRENQFSLKLQIKSTHYEITAILFALIAVLINQPFFTMHQSRIARSKKLGINLPEVGNPMPELICQMAQVGNTLYVAGKPGRMFSGKLELT